jgi:hypothetical protein
MDPLCPCQDGDACHYKDTQKTKALPVDPSDVLHKQSFLVMSRLQSGTEDVVRLDAALAAIAQARRDERERCAKVCDYLHASGRIVYTPDECAAAIRALADKGAQP